jgi:hypothetical protein
MAYCAHSEHLDLVTRYLTIVAADERLVVVGFLAFRASLAAQFYLRNMLESLAAELGR